MAPGVIPANGVLPPNYPHVPPNFPQNFQAFAALTANEIGALLTFYGQDANPVATRNLRLRVFLGMDA
jgi:hypothetical protein